MSGRWEVNCSRPEIPGELTAQMQGTMAGSSTGVISDPIESMPRRISACIATKKVALLLTDCNLLQAVTA
ncbi:hypothetical protein TNCV_673041 [Trichonephila clavipes]|nr:hypothetical protein TNCV_673041 [Trichonephila clavipes]